MTSADVEVVEASGLLEAPVVVVVLNRVSDIQGLGFKVRTAYLGIELRTWDRSKICRDLRAWGFGWEEGPFSPASMKHT